MKNIGVFKNAGNQGYILMPRRLLNLLFAEHDDLDLFKLYAYLLLKATFVVTDNIDLSHGELYYSLRTLSKKMGVTRYTVARMLHELEEYELIEIFHLKSEANHRASRCCTMTRCATSLPSTMSLHREPSEILTSSGICITKCRDWSQ